MPEDAGEKPPDPKAWKWCKHPECKDKLQKRIKSQRGYRKDKEKWPLYKFELDEIPSARQWMELYSDLCAIYDEDTCWKHLDEKNRKGYKSKIEEHKTELSGENLYGVDLVRANLTEADLKGANLSNADLREAEFSGAKLNNVFLYEARLDGAFHLEWDNMLPKVGEEKAGRWRDARHTYSLLKSYFTLQGRDGDARKVYYREKITAKHHLHQRICGLPPKKIKTASPWVSPFLKLVRCFQNIKRFFDSVDYKYDEDGETRTNMQRRRWLEDWFFHVFTGFGQRWYWTVLWALGVITLFAVIYGIGNATGVFLFDFKETMIPSIFQYFYLSVVTFATLGFGDITPLCWQAQIPVVIEVIFGYVFLGLIITIIARRFGR